MHVYGKSIATITDAGVDDFDYGPNGGFTAILSTPSLDRDGDKLKQVDWITPLPERLPLDVDHGMTVADTVGSFVPYFDGDNLMMRAYFASTAKAQDVRALVTPDEATGIRHISTVSVAFMNDKAAMKDGKPHRELLNAGIVAIPSNRDAVILASKAADAIDSIQKQVDEGVVEKSEVQASMAAVLDSATKAAATGAGNDGALVQAIHDASVHLGAQCAQPEVIEEDPSGDASGANKSVDTEEVETDDAEAKAADITIIIPEGFTRAEFENRLAGIFTPEPPQGNSPAESEPADEAATDEVPADDAAEESAAESEAPDWQTQASLLEMELFALPELSSDSQ